MRMVIFMSSEHLKNSVSSPWLCEKLYSLKDLVNCSNQTLGYCLRPYNDFFGFHTLLLLEIPSNLSGKSIYTSSSRFPCKKPFLTLKWNKFQ